MTGWSTFIAGLTGTPARNVTDGVFDFQCKFAALSFSPETGAIGALLVPKGVGRTKFVVYFDLKIYRYIRSSFPVVDVRAMPLTAQCGSQTLTLRNKLLAMHKPPTLKAHPRTKRSQNSANDTIKVSIEIHMLPCDLYSVQHSIKYI